MSFYYTTPGAGADDASSTSSSSASTSPYYLSHQHLLVRPNSVSPPMSKAAMSSPGSPKMMSAYGLVPPLECSVRFEASRSFEDDFEFCPALAAPAAGGFGKPQHATMIFATPQSSSSVGAQVKAQVSAALMAKKVRKGIEIIDPVTGVKMVKV